MNQRLIFLLVRVFRTVVTYYRVQKIHHFMQRIFSIWISFEFNVFGSGSTIHSPAHIRGGKRIRFGSNVSVGSRAILTAWEYYGGRHYSPVIVINNNSSIGEDCHITAIERIEIHENVLIGKRVTITDNSHGLVDYESLQIPPRLRILTTKGPVIIEENVWIGDKATILPGVRIGRSSVIGANSVITKSVPPYSVVAGCPGKVIKNVQVMQ